MKSLLNLQPGIKSRVVSLSRDSACQQERKSFMCRRRTINKSLTILLLTIFFVVSTLPLIAFAERPQLVAPEKSVKVGKKFNVTVYGIPEGKTVTWEPDQILTCKGSGTTISCISDTEGQVEVKASIKEIGWSDSVSVSIDKTGGLRGSKQTEIPASKFDKISSLFERLKSGELNEMVFFKEMGDSPKISVKDLVAFKKEVYQLKHKEVGYYKDAADHWNDNFRPMEQALMNVRKEMIMNAWEAAVKEYLRENPGKSEIFKMDVGAWVSETKEKMRFEGDIDFSIIMLKSEDAIIIRDKFKARVEKIFNLDMVAIDALATAHRAATLSVYIGEYGADWAEKDAILRGKMEAVSLDEGGRVISRDVGQNEKTALFTILKNNEGLKKGKPDMLDQIKAEKAEPKPTYDMEPGISLEFLRHITEDAIHAELAPHEKLMKICKYLDRSAKEYKAIMKDIFKVEPNLLHPELINLAEEVIKAKQDKKLNPDETYLKIMMIGETLMGSAWLNDPEAFLKKLGQRAAEVMKNNIETAVGERQKRIDSADDPSVKETEKRKLFDELTKEYDAFKQNHLESEFPAKAKAVMNDLAAHFKRTALKMPPEEQKKLKELFERMVDNPKAAQTWLAITWERMNKLYNKTDEAIDGFNSFLDKLDSHTIDQLRNNNVIEFEFTKERKIRINNPIPVKAINDALNETILGSIGRSTAFKGANLALEWKAYYDAAMHAENWSAGFKNIGWELASRHLPGWNATEALVNEDIGRFMVEMVYLFCPLTAIPEGLFGMAEGAAEWGVGKLEKWRYDELVQVLYDSAAFEKSGTDWRMTGFRYECPPVITLSIDKKTKSQEGLYQLLGSCKKVSDIIHTQIKQHPALSEFEKMLGDKAVSSGQTSNPKTTSGWPYRYYGLSKYGDKLYDIYIKKVDAVTLEYFKGVIQGLESRKAWDTGTGYSKILSIGKELKCDKPLAEYTTLSVTGYVYGDKEQIKQDAERFNKIVEDYKQLKAGNAGIDGLKKKWGADFLEGLISGCTPKNIELRKDEAIKLLEKLNKAVAEARVKVVKEVGNSPKDEDLVPITKAKLCMAYYDNKSDDYSKCYEELQELLRKLGKKAVDVTVTVRVSGEICPGQKLPLAFEYNKPCPECSVSGWEIKNEEGTSEYTSSESNPIWIPESSGLKTVNLTVKQVKIKDVHEPVIKGKATVNVKPQKECSALKISLEPVGITTIAENATLELTAKTDSLAPGNPQIKRYFWKENGKQTKATDEPVYTFFGKGKAGKTVQVSVVARDEAANYAESSVEIEVTKGTAKGLTVQIRPAEARPGKDGTLAMKDDEIITLKSAVSAMKDSGRLNYQWVVGDDSVLLDGIAENTTGIEPLIFSGTVFKDKTVKVSLVVVDEKGRQGIGTLTIKVISASAITLKLNDHRTEIYKNQVETIIVEEPRSNDGKRYKYFWNITDDKGVTLFNHEYDYKFSISGADYSGKKLSITVKVTDPDGRTGQVKTAITVKDEDEDAPADLIVNITVDKTTITENESVTYSVTIQPFPDSGTLTVNGVRLPKGTTSFTNKLEGSGHQGIVPLNVVVTDSKGRKGEATATIYVNKKEDKQAEEKKKKEEEQKKQEEAEQERIKKEKIVNKKPLNMPENIGGTGDKSGATHGTGTTGSCGPYKFSASAPDIWSGGNTDKGFRMDRQKAQATNPEAGSISANVWVSVDHWSNSPKSVEDILSSLQKKVKEGSGGCGGAEPWIEKEVTTFEIDDFKGGLVDFGVWFIRNYSHSEGRGSASICSNGHGYVINKEGCLIGIKFTIGGYGGPEATDRSYLRPQAQAAHSEMLAILKSLRIDANGTITKTPYKGRNLDGSDMMKVKLVPASLGKVKVGESIKLHVEVENARPDDLPFKYTWTGSYDGSGATVKTQTMKPGKYTVSVSVDGAQGPAGSASLEYTVAEPITVKLEKLKPTGNSVVIGQAGSFRATVMAGGSPASGDFVIRWEPYKDRVAQFKARETQGASGTNEIKFMSPGNYFVYVDVLEKVEGKLQTAGESEQISIQAINPTWEMGFEPAQPKVGQLVNAKVQATGVTAEDMKTMSFEWRLSDNAKQTGADQKDGVATFYLKDTKPANIKCVVRLDGENLGGAGKTITAQGYQVSISEPKYSGPPIQMWQCETQLGGAPKCGMVQLKSTQFVTHSDIHFAVTTTPAPEGPRYKWSIDPAGSCGSPGAGSEIKINCSNTGTYTVRAEVTNAEGVKLGEASSAINITISQEQINKSNKAKEAYEKLQKAKELVLQGRLDEGIQMADEASQLDPKNTEATKLSNTWKRDKQNIQSYLKNMDAKLTQHKVEEAEKELAQAQKLHPKYQPVVDAEKRLQDAKKKAEEEKKKAEELKKQIVDKIAKAKELVAQGKLDEGIAMIDEALKLDPKNTEASGLASKWKAEKQTVIKHVADVKQLITGSKIPEAEKALSEAQRLHPKYAPVIEAEKLLKAAKSKKDVIDKIAKAKELVGQGKLDEGIALISEAVKLDPKQKEAAAQGAKWKAEKQIVMKHVGSIKKLLSANKIVAAEKELVIAQKLHSKYAPVVEVEKLLNAAKQKETDKNKDKQVAKEKQAQALLNEGGVLEQKGDLAGAIKKYEAAVKILPNKSISDHIVELQKKIKDENDKTKKEAQANALLKEGGVLEQKGDLAGAIKKYQAAVNIVPNNKISDHIVELQKKITDGSKENQAQTLLNEGGVLEQKGDLAGAIKKYEAAVKIVPNKKISDHIVELLKKIKEAGNIKNEQKKKEAQANALLKAGGVLEKKGDLAGAIKKYEAAVNIVPDNGTSEHIAELQEKIRAKKIAKGNGTKNRQAQKLINEGNALEQKGNLAGAIKKYQEAVKIVPDQGTSDHITDLKNKIIQNAQALKDKRAAVQAQAQQPLPTATHIPDEPVVAILLKPGIYRSAAGNSWMFTNVTSTSMSFAWWQTNEAYPPKDHSKYFGRGTAKAIGGGLWRISGKDQPGYCCGNETKTEFRILSPTSVEFLRGSYWTIGTARHPEGQWNINERVVLNLVQDKTPITTTVAPSKKALNIAGSWEHVDGNCAGARMEISQDVNNGVTIDEEGHCRGGEHSKTKVLCHFEQDKRTLSCSYHFTLRPAGWVDGKLEIVFTDENNAQMPWRANDGQRGTTRLKRVGIGNETQKNISQQPEKQSVQPSGKTGAEKTDIKSKVISNNWNIGGVSAKPTKPTRFKLTQSSHITLIENYHYSSKKLPGAMRIRAENGKEYGPFTAVGNPALPPRESLWYWQCYPNITLSPGTYTVIDSDPATWSHNSESGGSGFSRIEGYPVRQR